MKTIKFVYFDIGNVLADTTNYFRRTTSKFKIPIDKFIKFWSGDDAADDLTRGKITTEEFWKKAIRQFNLKNAEDFDFLESWMDDYKPNPEVHELAKQVSEKYKIGLLSNLYPGMMPRIIEKSKVPDLKYSSIVLSCVTGFRKPEAEIYNIATKKAGVKPSEILLLDDREEFIERAKKAGWQTVWFDMENKEKAIKQVKKLLGI